MHVDGSHNNIIISLRQTEKQSSSSSESDIDSAESSNTNDLRWWIDNLKELVLISLELVMALHYRLYFK